MGIFFTSDTHFYHEKIIGYCKRPYVSVEEMNAALIANWNAVVTSEDEVYHLGDFGIGNIQKMRSIREQLNGKIHLIRGNHDIGFSKQSWIDKVGMSSVHDELVFFTGYFLRHIPFEVDTRVRSDNVFRKLQYRIKPDDSMLILCGHIHDCWKFRNNHFNVGVDVNQMRPISHIQLIHELIISRRENIYFGSEESSEPKK